MSEQTAENTDTKVDDTKVKKPRKKAMKGIKAKAPDRKRRMDKNAKAGVKNVLTIPEEYLDRENFEYRVANTEPGRVEYLETRDWDVARLEGGIVVGDSAAGKAQTVGTVVNVPVGGGKQGVLMCKRKEWCDDDRKAKENVLLEKEKTMQSDYKQKHEPIE